jgi:hypothetical protein
MEFTHIAPPISFRIQHKSGILRIPSSIPTNVSNRKIKINKMNHYNDNQ